MNLEQMLELVVQRNGSDLHLVPGFYPMIRVHGDLVPIQGTEVLTQEQLQALIYPMFSPYQKQVFETMLELDFSFSFKDQARFRVNIYRQRGVASAELRMIPMKIPLVDSLGLPEIVKKLIELKQGLILVTGPTGHGKSTSLAAMINEINMTRSDHIVTIEDPIEYVYPKGKSLVSQREMFQDTKTWPNALRAVLREDPDVVLVGEMRDYETIASTITIAETGHLVFATLHTNSASQSVDRIIDVFPENQQPQIRMQLASTLVAIISQRLIPTIIPGRVLAVELLLGNSALSSMIRESKTHQIDNMIQTSAEIGMMTLEGSLVRLVREGKISFEIAQSYSLRPDLLAKLMGK